MFFVFLDGYFIFIVGLDFDRLMEGVFLLIKQNLFIKMVYVYYYYFFV